LPEYAFQKSSRPGRRRRQGPPDNLPQGEGSPWPALAGFLGLCLLVAISAGAITAPAIEGWYGALVRPPLTPPNWLFGPVWTLLYLTVGASAWLVWWKAPQGRRQSGALQLWGWQLLLNALWSPAFFGLHSPVLGLAVIVPLLGLIALTAVRFGRLVRPAGAMLLPYFAWCCFAAYLNLGFWWLNR
jgi:translocator protein